MTLKHLQSLTSSKKPFQLTSNQLIHIAMENKIPIKQIMSLPNNQKLKILDHQQLCTLISQHGQSSPMQNSIHVTQQRVYLDVGQIFSLAKYSNTKFDQLTTCVTEQIDVSITIKSSFPLIFCLVYRL
jgi:hypothetical protein